MDQSISAIERKGIVKSVTDCPISFVKIVVVIIITKKPGYVQIIGNNIE